VSKQSGGGGAPTFVLHSAGANQDVDGFWRLGDLDLIPMAISLG
jgi:hypothetical protein